jgi:alpha-amylase/alpha-mannosidase (GH57 family)
MIYWAPLLHFYQPPTQSHGVLAKVCEESYRPLVRVFKEYPESRVTVNMCGVLTEMLADHGYQDILKGLEKLSQAGQVEFTGSAKFHAILPLIPEIEAKRQISLNKITNLSFFKDSYKPRGFFLPEMCYSDETASIVRGMGYEWVIVSGIACQGKWPMDYIPTFKLGSGSMKAFFRDDIISNMISFKNIDAVGFVSRIKELAKGKEDSYIITAMDAETFGHHIRGWENIFLAKVYEIIEDSDKVKAVKISDLLEKFPAAKTKPPKPSSWSTSNEEIMAGNYYPLWNTPHNNVHRLQWEHMNMCLEIFQEAENKKNIEKSEPFFNTARETLDMALHSCQFWWANKARMWNENLINKGLILQEETMLNSYLAVANSGCKDSEKKRCYNKVIAARHIAGKIRDEIVS